MKTTNLHLRRKKGDIMNQNELKRLFEACRKLNIKTVKDLERFKIKHNCKTNKELLDALEKAEKAANE